MGAGLAVVCSAEGCSPPDSHTTSACVSSPHAEKKVLQKLSCFERRVRYNTAAVKVSNTTTPLIETFFRIRCW